MRFNTKTRYALRAMIEIARAGKSKRVFQKDIVKSQNISPKYLDHIIQALKSEGLIHSVKGRTGGYRLTRDASEISVLQIHNAFEPEIAVVECLSEHIGCDMESVCKTRDFWTGLNCMVVAYLQKVSLKDLAEEKKINFTLAS